MDVDNIEIQIWTRQADGTHQMRWVPLRELIGLIQDAALTALSNALNAPSEATSAPPPSSSSPA